MSGRRSHETEHCIDEGPVAVEEGAASVDEMLQHSPDMREGSGVTSEWCQSLVHGSLAAPASCLSFVDQQCSEVLDCIDVNR